ncbi:LPS export ABC transporter periplasmic protein LptC [Desulfobacter hydrogenophilus]|uniref:LPS export ABC transporter periplasmic protein LptC n=1 Tax=Desulfobacter hydrogenophilus TaxID=2291 RepID=A0A328FGI0_9BACT|nr:LPS export ABC transporter periplasmic protein LptC [Desulfobacter hydrogenophilus]NDY71772.1 LPS export ABC transporter periplasmic protein LptC [Desulfobacter hydrogenophilus]QBH13470.1 LPS export ABC transporter periplasmic protein LptC [Desulfobacter hydrogenophilus]RAM03721.1 LPS export ABC transporter periplasmic protein LptC [Desulfobacter hydrogenophilus]
MSRGGKKKLILPIVLLLGLILAGLGLYYYINHLLTTPIELENIEVDDKAALKLNALEQISKKNGITEWKLKASSATLLKDRNKAVLKDVDIIFYTKQNTQVHLTADQGELNTKTHDMTFSRHVTIQYQHYTLTSETLHYAKEAHIIRSDLRVTVDDEDSVIEADSMEILLEQNLIILKGHVEGNFSENSQNSNIL